MSDPNATPGAGWYPDPEDDAGERWWNGVGWSDHRRAVGDTTTWTPSAAPRPSAAAAAKTAAASAGSAAPAIPVPPVAPPPAARPNPYAAGAALPPYTGTGAASPPPYSPGYGPPAPTTQNGLALAGMIVALSGLLVNFILFGLAGWVGGGLSIAGLVKANKLAARGVTVGNGRGMAITGIVVGFGGALLFNVFLFAVSALPSLNT